MFQIMYVIVLSFVLVSTIRLVWIGGKQALKVYKKHSCTWKTKIISAAFFLKEKEAEWKIFRRVYRLFTVPVKWLWFHLNWFEFSDDVWIKAKPEEINFHKNTRLAEAVYMFLAWNHVMNIEVPVSVTSVPKINGEPVEFDAVQKFEQSFFWEGEIWNEVFDTVMKMCASNHCYDGDIDAQTDREFLAKYIMSGVEYMENHKFHEVITEDDQHQKLLHRKEKLIMEFLSRRLTPRDKEVMLKVFKKYASKSAISTSRFTYGDWRDDHLRSIKNTHESRKKELERVLS